MDRNGGNVRRLTSSQAIDTEPVFTPDGRSIYFVSDRGGGPQIYRIAAGGGNVERITFGGSYNISPAISPDGAHAGLSSRARATPSSCTRWTCPRRARSRCR